MYLLEVEPLNFGPEVQAIGLQLIDPESREPVRGAEAGRIWSRVLAAVAGAEPWALDFFSHLDRVRDYCARHQIIYREAAARCLVVPAPAAGPLAELLERFAAETFGVRVGARLAQGDSGLENDLARRGVDAYHHAYSRYFFCAICDLDEGFLTLLTDRLRASEVVRRAAPSVRELHVEVRLPA